MMYTHFVPSDINLKRVRKEIEKGIKKIVLLKAHKSAGREFSRFSGLW